MKEQEIQILDDADLQDVAGGFHGVGGLFDLYQSTFDFIDAFGFSPNASGNPKFSPTYYHNLIFKIGPMA